MTVPTPAQTLLALVMAGFALVGVPQASAQPSPEPVAADGLLARAVEREGARLAAQGANASAVSAARAGDADWSRVVRLKRGIPIVLTPKGLGPLERYFLAGNAEGITVLDVTGPNLPADAVKILRGEAPRNPECLAGARRGSPCELKKGVVLAPDGVFVGDLKVAELPSVVSMVPREDVAVVQRAADSSWARHSFVRGFLTGAAYGGGVSALFCLAYHGCGTEVLYVTALGGAVFATIDLTASGAAHAYEKSRELVYRAPRQ